MSREHWDHVEFLIDGGILKIFSRQLQQTVAPKQPWYVLLVTGGQALLVYLQSLHHVYYM